ncbi:hypothetical protein ACPOL_1794 [Acidisarcina polymorpha]|uniref:Uncharacterized protein n=1 Tax=Acidisarcina polymorpha TaxID=2211140 RepID=A0A2Z5FXN2_9BACT|nr:hypothetical protein ACPOL_1794 [Acidisarcina polymorpha]
MHSGFKSHMRCTLRRTIPHAYRLIVNLSEVGGRCGLWSTSDRRRETADDIGRSSHHDRQLIASYEKYPEFKLCVDQFAINFPFLGRDILIMAVLTLFSGVKADAV